MATSDAPTPTTPRRFNLGDGLILLAALAICLERFRATHWFQAFPRLAGRCVRAVGFLIGLTPWDADLGATRVQVIDALPGQLIDVTLRTIGPVLLGLMVAQPMIRLRHPRPTISEVVRQSGFTTCLIGLILVAMLLPMGAFWFSGLALTLGMTRVLLLLMLWPMLALPPWKAERGWVDRLGRAVGWGWILAMAGAAVLDHQGRL